MTDEPKPQLIRERLDVCELDKARMAILNPALIEQKKNERTIDENAKPVLELMLREGVETVWDRYEMQQPSCKYCLAGTSCSRCTMGPCRIIPPNRIRGVCGADADLIVSRNLLDMIATGSAAHSDHGRDIAETLYLVGTGKAGDYAITDNEKLKRISEEYGIKTEGKKPEQLAAELGGAMLDEYGMRKNTLQFLNRAPKATREIWAKLGITPRGIDREVVDSMHRVQMGVGADYVNILLQGLRTSLSDGWGGSMIGTEVSDILFGTPTIKSSTMNLAVMKADHVNISVHGHNPVLSEVIVKAVADPEMKALARNYGAKGINLVGMCCTGSELLMRKGIPMTGNHLNQELIIATGALEAMVVDYQCIFPSLPRTASCYHTLIISTSEKATIPGSYFFDFHAENAYLTAKAIVRMAVENYKNRNPQRVLIPGEPVPVMTGFSNEAIKNALGGSFKPLIDLIATGKIRGAVGIVGCNNPHIKHDFGHIMLAKELIRKNILCVETGCAAIASGKAGLLRPEAASLAGDDLRAVCESLKIPPVLHMGSCVDNSRILVLAAELGNALNIPIHKLPIAGAAPEWYSQKAVSIGAYFVASGVYTVLGVMPHISGSPPVVSLLTEGLKGVVNASFAVEPDPVKASVLISDHIERKRTELGFKVPQTINRAVSEEKNCQSPKCQTGIRIVITGKGGVGKTTITAILAHLFAQTGFRVLAVDGDPQQNLAVTLGILPQDAEQIVPVSQSTEYLREKTGARPGNIPGGLLTLNPEVSDVIERFSISVTKNLRLLVMGGVSQAGCGCLCPEYTLLAAIFRHMRVLPDEVVLLDTPAGMEHFGRAVADGFSCSLVVADPSYNALSVARESAVLAQQLGIRDIILVVNRADNQAESDKIRKTMEGSPLFSRMIFLPRDPEIVHPEPSVSRLLSGNSELIRSVKILSGMVTKSG